MKTKSHTISSPTLKPLLATSRKDERLILCIENAFVTHGGIIPRLELMSPEIKRINEWERAGYLTCGAVKHAANATISDMWTIADKLGMTTGTTAGWIWVYPAQEFLDAAWRIRRRNGIAAHDKIPAGLLLNVPTTLKPKPKRSRATKGAPNA